MRPLAECRVAPQDETVRQVLIRVGVPGRRTGATMLVDGRGRLAGIFTDSDLARLFERRRDADLDAPIRDVMTRNPLKTTAGSMMIDAVAVLAQRKISELPVVDALGRPLGLIDITDVVALLPGEAAAAGTADRAGSPHPRIPPGGRRTRSLSQKEKESKGPRCRVFPAHEPSP